MMKQKLILILAVVGVLGVNAQEKTNMVANSVGATNWVEKVVVTGNRVSLRSKPNIQAGILDKAMKGQELIFFSETNGWTSVQAPEQLDFWVSGQYLKDGVVVPPKLNVRSGPSGNYTVMCVVKKGDQLDVRGAFNDWIKIAPPKGSKVWISSKYVERVEPPKPKVVVTEAPKKEVVKKEVPQKKPIPAAPALKKSELKPLLLVLDKSKKQGEYAEIPGVLRRANPGLYKLVWIDGNYEETICLVRGEKKQMEKYLNRSLLIKGKQYWAKDVEWPVLRPEKIHLDPIISE